MGGQDLHILVLAGGNSTRIKTGGPKALLDLCGRPLLEWVFEATSGLAAASRQVVLGGVHQQAIEKHLRKRGLVAEEGQDPASKPWQVVEQPEALGTGDAVRCAFPTLPEEGRLLILCGDTPLLQAETLAALCQAPGGALLTARFPDPTGYGRILRDAEGRLQAIVEQADCDAETAAIQEGNAGVYCLDLAKLRLAIAELDTDNAQGEFYLTDAALQVLKQSGGHSHCLESGHQQVEGVNTLAQLALVSVILRQQILAEHMASGVILADPSTTYIETGVEIGPGATIHPFCVLRHGVRIEAGCEVGPFAHLRVGAHLEAGSAIGNFVEAKNARLGPGAKAKHLTYLGDAVIGAKANIGCGTITANYDGKIKSQTQIGEGAFIGSGTVLVAPVKVGDGAITGAGAVVTRNHDVAEGQTVVGVPARPLPSPSVESA